jgi:hypothetical protein
MLQRQQAVALYCLLANTSTGAYSLDKKLLYVSRLIGNLSSCWKLLRYQSPTSFDPHSSTHIGLPHPWTCIYRRFLASQQISAVFHCVTSATLCHDKIFAKAGLTFQDTRGSHTTATL